MKIRTFFFIADAAAKALECLSMFLHESLIFLESPGAHTVRFSAHQVSNFP
jgi:hypothetical protein